MNSCENVNTNESEKVDILENKIYEIDSKILETLLIDRTSNKNILWGTDNYIKYGPGYGSSNSIEINLITGRKGNVIKPRTKKSNIEKKKRIKEKAEVFTPSWACNHQNNLVDKEWFGRKNVFNEEFKNGWKTNSHKIVFDNKTWMEYVLDLRLEITCGEAPYVVSRYDTVTGDVIDTQDRIGILDRKIRVVNENTTESNWLEWVIKAYQSVYGYEWQGDSLLIARENLLYTFIDYYIAKFGERPNVDKILIISDIISWNFWQMDGLKGVIPNSCDNEMFVQYNLFGEAVTTKCYGCEDHKIHNHNGKYCKIKDWQKNKVIKFVDLISRRV